jgi:imidazole glycerol-phosphate synthase subunit HisF
LSNFRLIARLDIKNSNLIKGVQFEGLRVLGDPNTFAQRYYNQGIDELLYIDSVASLYGRNHLASLIKNATKNIFVPITVGGGIRTLDDASRILKSGADKVAINTGAVKNPTLLKDIAEHFGSQSLVLSIQSRKVGKSKWEAYIESGREKTGIDVVDWVAKAINLGIGELLLTSVDRDGTKKGLDLELIEEVGKICTIPMIVGGGIASAQDIIMAHKLGANASAIASTLHYNDCSVMSLRNNLNDEEIGIRKIAY